eukprot:COSAG02_NODE_4853_length_4900_cov_4.210998_1_plen_66_part_00
MAMLLLLLLMMMMMITFGDSMPSRLGAAFSSTATGVAFGGAELDFAFFRGIADPPHSTVCEVLGL